MLYKALALAALFIGTNAAGGAIVDPRMLWFRWAVPLGGGYQGAKDETTGTYNNEAGQNIRKCGVDVAPNSIRKCYWTDCFKRLHPLRRRMGAASHQDKSYLADCGQVRRRRMAGDALPLAIACNSHVCDTDPQMQQFRYWVSGPASTAGLGRNATGCPKGTFKDWNSEYPGFSNPNGVKSEESWQWYGTQQASNCIYDAPPANCQCKTLVCKVSTDKESGAGLTTGGWAGNRANNAAAGTAASNTQTSDECNFMVRIEDYWPSQTVSKKMMWWIFTIAGLISLFLTAYYYVVYGDELVKEEEGGSEGSGN